MKPDVRLALLPLVLLASVALALWANLPPAPGVVNGQTAFDLARAKETVATIASAPHPVGSLEHARVRDEVAVRLRALGLIVEIQDGFGVRQRTRGDHAITTAPVENIIAVLPGRNRAAPSVAVMAHYDSVPYAPGAGDDGAGVAAVLETARVMTANPPPARDVIFLITDSEEMGLLGAQLFFTRHQFAQRVGIVVNADTRGVKGRAIMFQTSPGNAALIDLWARHAVSPTGNSLTNAIYQLLPNDTDMSVSLAAGKAGINSAFVDGQFDYHAPSDSPTNLDPGTLQHQGQFVLAMTQALANADALPVQGADATYFDVFSLAVVRYPPVLGWALTAIAGALLLLLWRREKRGWRVGWRVLGILGLTVGVGVACHLLGMLIWPDHTIGMRERLAEAPAAFWVWFALCLGAAIMVRPSVDLWLGALTLLLVLAVAAQIALPGGNWLFAWPLLVMLIIALVAPRGALALALSALVGGGAFALAFQTVALSYVSLGAMTPGVMALMIPFVIALLGPLAIPWSERGLSRRTGAGAIALGLAGFGWLALSDGFTSRTPRPGDLFHLTDVDAGTAWWATTSGRAELPAGKAERYHPPVYTRAIFTRSPAPLVAAAPRPRISLVQEGRAVTITVDADAPQFLVVAVKPTGDVRNARVNGEPVTLNSDEPTRISYRAARPAHLVLTFDSEGAGAMVVDWLYSVPGLPAGAPTPNGPATNWTQLSHTTTSVGVTNLGWK